LTICTRHRSPCRSGLGREAFLHRHAQSKAMNSRPRPLPQDSIRESLEGRRATQLCRAHLAAPAYNPALSPWGRSMSALLAAWRHAPTHRRVWALAAPMILSNLSVPLVALVDSTVIGHLPHAHQLASVAVGGTLYTLLVWVMGFLRMGTTGFAAQASGRNDG